MKPLKSVYYIALCLLSVQSVCVAQQDILYFSETDSAYVKIDKRSILNPKSIIYSSRDDNEKKEITADEFYGFLLEDGRLFKSIVKKGEALILQELVSGPIYLYEQYGKEEFYFQKNGELIYIENKFLDGRLKILLEDCSDWQNIVKGKTSYTAAYLKQVSIAYNKCVDPSYETDNKDKSKGGVNITKGVKLAYNHNLVRFDNPLSARYEADVNGSFGFQVGAMFLLESPKSPVSFQVELNFTQKASSATNDRTSTSLNFQSELSYKVSYISFPIILKYNLINQKSSKFSPFIHAGFDNGFLIGQDIQESGRLAVPRTNFDDNLRNFESGFLAGLGVSKSLKNNDALDFELRYSSTFYKLIFPEQIVVNRLFAFSVTYRR